MLTGRLRTNTFVRAVCLGLFVVGLSVDSQSVDSQTGKIVWSSQKRPIEQQLQRLRELPDDVRAKTTVALALKIRKLAPSANKVTVATWLTSLSTEGDFGHDTVQEVATTLSQAIQETPPADSQGNVAYPYTGLAQLVRYEHVHASLHDPKFNSAVNQLEAGTPGGSKQISS